MSCENFLPSQPYPNNYSAVGEQTYRFQGAELQAEHPPIGDASNRVATTGWVESYLSGTPMMPIVTDAGGLTINVSSGTVNKPPSGVCNVSATTSPISVVANNIEYVWVRYNDCAIVVSTESASSDEGQLIARVYTGPTHIIRIENLASIAGWARQDSPFFTGDPQAPHPPLGDSDHSIPTTQWVQDEIESKGFAPINSPLFTGDPRAPHPARGDSDETIPTTRWVQDEITSRFNSPNLTGTPLTTHPPLGSDNSQIPTTRWVQETLDERFTEWGTGLLTDIESQVTSLAPIDSPTFTGDPKVSTPPVGDSDSSIPNTQWVQGELTQAKGELVGQIEQAKQDLAGHIEEAKEDLKEEIQETFQDALYKWLFGPEAPIFTISGAGVSWGPGRVSIGGPYVDIAEGGRSFTSNETGVFYTYMTTNGPVIQRHDLEGPSGLHTLFNTIHVKNGTVLAISLPPVGRFGY